VVMCCVVCELEQFRGCQFFQGKAALANHLHERDAGSNSGSFFTLSKWGNRSIETEGAKPSVGGVPVPPPQTELRRRRSFPPTAHENRERWERGGGKAILTAPSTHRSTDHEGHGARTTHLLRDEGPPR